MQGYLLKRTVHRCCMIAFLMLGGCAAAADESPGHVAFFSVDAAQSGDANEPRIDFVYFYRSIRPWLDEQGLTHSFHSNMPVVVETARNTTITFTGDMLGSDRGTILLKGDGARHVLHGVYTDVDLSLAIQEFFGIGT